MVRTKFFFKPKKKFRIEFQKEISLLRFWPQFLEHLSPSPLPHFGFFSKQF